MGRLQDKVMLITGAGSGLGREVAMLAAGEGAKVIVTDKVDARIAPVVDTIVKAGGTASGVHLDVTDEASVEAGVRSAVETYGRLDVVHANAGVTVLGQGSVPFERTSRSSSGTRLTTSTSSASSSPSSTPSAS